MISLANIFALFVWLPLVLSVIVSTNYGDIEGLVTPYPNASTQFKSVNKFFGVPFAGCHLVFGGTK